MDEKNDSLLEIATNLMKRKKKPQTLDAILDEAFQKKGFSKDDEAVCAQFEVDFMLSGLFIYCGEDKNGNQLWDLKERQPSSLLDKDGGYLEDIYADDEDVIKNELKDDNFDEKAVSEFTIDDDEIEEKGDDEDDIEEELGLVDEDAETQELDSDFRNDIDEDELEEDEEEEDDIAAELNKRK